MKDIATYRETIEYTNENIENTEITFRNNLQITRSYEMLAAITKIQKIQLSKI